MWRTAHLMRRKALDILRLLKENKMQRGKGRKLQDLRPIVPLVHLRITQEDCRNEKLKLGGKGQGPVPSIGDLGTRKQLTWENHGKRSERKYRKRTASPQGVPDETEVELIVNPLDNGKPLQALREPRLRIHPTYYTVGHLCEYVACAPKVVNEDVKAEEVEIVYVNPPNKDGTTSARLRILEEDETMGSLCPRCLSRGWQACFGLSLQHIKLMLGVWFSFPDPLYVAYHDEEWGVPTHDDKLLFELLVLSGAQVGSDWASILKKRQDFRNAFAGFDADIVADLNERQITSISTDYGIELSRVRGIVDNANCILEIRKEFGSFDKYLWGFVNNKPISTQYKSCHKIPVKTSKSESISKDMVRRGFRFVGPTVMHSFMQAAGLTNDHLTTCTRHLQCMALASQKPAIAAI